MTDEFVEYRKNEMARLRLLGFGMLIISRAYRERDKFASWEKACLHFKDEMIKRVNP